MELVQLLNDYIIYKTVNKINGKIYIGQHRRSKQWYLGSGISLREAVKKYGKENFKRETIEKLKQVSQNVADRREKYWIEVFNARDPEIGYNIAEGGLTKRGRYRIRGTYKHSKQALEKIKRSAAKRKGKPSWNSGIRYGDDRKKNMKGKIKTQAHREKLRTIAIKNQYGQRLGKSNKGKASSARLSIKQLTKEGKLIKVWSSITGAATELKLRVSDIARCCKGINKTCGKYKWEYYE